MKKHRIKIVALVLTVLVFVGLTGCGSAKNDAPEPEPTETAAAGNRIYFAAPLFSEAERDYNLKIVSILESYDIADLYKTETSIPAAFETVQNGSADIEKDTSKTVVE